HCCPQGTTCDLTHSTCTSLGASAPLAALPTGKAEQPPPALSQGGDSSPECPLSPAGEVKCDERTSCPDGNTCCRLTSGAWGCCPLEQGSCCSDGRHCCPAGSRCTAGGRGCSRQHPSVL
ncbi:GRN protein, partial [Rhadina sibilatrix]|nr:GRN protein [Rhadina sibilatrix]